MCRRACISTFLWCTSATDPSSLRTNNNVPSQMKMWRSLFLRLTSPKIKGTPYTATNIGKICNKMVSSSWKFATAFALVAAATVQGFVAPMTRTATRVPFTPVCMADAVADPIAAGVISGDNIRWELSLFCDYAGLHVMVFEWWIESSFHDFLENPNFLCER